MLKTPVLLLIFNRPDHTRRVLDSIRKAKPERLYIASDGPRKNNKQDERLCAATKEVVEHIDWPCDVKRLYRNENMSCDYAIIDAVNWFFSMEDEGIILEDDCIPSVSFFQYCSLLLEAYRNNPDIAMISGTLFYNKELTSKHNFYISDFMYTWGFATWKRVWTDIDFYRKIDYKIAEQCLMKRYNNHALYVESHLRILRDAEKEPIPYWDYSFFIHNLCKGMSGIIPNVNLVSNIGNSGTHFIDSKSLLLNTPIHELTIKENFLSTVGTLTESHKKKIMKAIVQKIYPVGIKNKLHLLKKKLSSMLKLW